MPATPSLPRRAGLAALALLALAAPLDAQKAPPPRPPLDAGADTNDAFGYLAKGAQWLEGEPRRAVAAFWWAARLDPTSADALYGERIALLMSDKDQLVLHMNRDRRVRDRPELKRADSLQSLALTRAPLHFRRWDRKLLTAYMNHATVRSMQRGGGGTLDLEDRTELAHEVDRWLMREAPPWMRAWVAYSDGKFQSAASLYDNALKKAKPHQRADLLAERARVLVHLGALDSAVAAMREALTAGQAEQDERLAFAHESRPEREYVLGALLESSGDTAGARAAYGRALTENLGYHPAHRALAVLALASGDSASAVREFAQAVEIAGDEAELRHGYALALIDANRAMEAVEQLMKATTLEPHWAAPWFVLARLHDASEMREDATRLYRDFLVRASNSDPLRAFAEQRIAELAASGAKQ